MMDNFLKLAAWFLIIVVFSSCNKDTVMPATLNVGLKAHQPGLSQVSASLIEPSSGITFSAVRITGSNFDPVTTNNVVKFNGVTAVVNYVLNSATIIATVPAGARTGPITVTTNGVIATVPNTFKILQLVKDGSTKQSTNLITSVAVDKYGALYATQQFPHYAVVGKYTNGGFNILYTTAIDTSYGSYLTNSGYSHNTISSLMADGNGNIYAGWNQLSVYDSEIDEVETLETNIIKITPTGIAAEYAHSGLESGSVDGGFYDISAESIDAQGNIYALNHNVSRIRKIQPDGTQSLAYIPQVSATYMIADAGGNIYTNDWHTITKYDTHGSSKIIATFPYAAGLLGNMAVDAAGDLFVIKGESVMVINQAGSINTLPPGEMLNSLSFDNAGHLYTLSNSAITRYSFQ